MWSLDHATLPHTKEMFRLTGSNNVQHSDKTNQQSKFIVQLAAYSKKWGIKKRLKANFIGNWSALHYLLYSISKLLLSHFYYKWPRIKTVQRDKQTRFDLPQ